MRKSWMNANELSCHVSSVVLAHHASYDSKAMSNAVKSNRFSSLVRQHQQIVWCQTWEKLWSNQIDFEESKKWNDKHSMRNYFSTLKIIFGRLKPMENDFSRCLSTISLFRFANFGISRKLRAEKNEVKWMAELQNGHPLCDTKFISMFHLLIASDIGTIRDIFMLASHSSVRPRSVFVFFVFKQTSNVALMVFLSFAERRQATEHPFRFIHCKINDRKCIHQI